MTYFYAPLQIETKTCFCYIQYKLYIYIYIYIYVCVCLCTYKSSLIKTEFSLELRIIKIGQSYFVKKMYIPYTNYCVFFLHMPRDVISKKKKK